MSRIYITLLAAAALTVSVTGAIFSMVGLTSLFAGAIFSVAIMAGSLEFAKVVTAGFLYRYWGHVNRWMRLYLSAAVVVLSMITSLGIFGYLSNAYQKSSIAFKKLHLEMDALKSKDVRVHEEIQKIEKFIEEIPASRISKKFAIYEESRAHVKSLNEQSKQINDEIDKLRHENLTTQTEIGPIVYVADALGVGVDVVAQYLILTFVSVFDPLALCLVFALSLAIRLREKYRGDEYRIGKLSLTKPVDHRLRKTA
jgi:hypothetical protein